MGIFGGGSAKRAAGQASKKVAEARMIIEKARDKYIPYYDPYRQVGERAIDPAFSALEALQNRYAGLDAERLAMSPQIDEMYDLATQQDTILDKISSGNYDAYKQTPGYEFRLKEGLKALENSASAGAGSLGSQQLKALQKYGQDYASNEYDKYLQRLYNEMGAVNTQLAGRQAALTPKQNQLTQGLNIAGGEQSVAQQFQNLVNMGMSASDAAAKMGMSASEIIAQLTKEEGAIDAAGMMAKNSQLQAMGDQLMGLAGGLFGGVTGGALGGLAGSLTGGGASLPFNFGGGGQTIMPYTGSTGESLLQSLANRFSGNDTQAPATIYSGAPSQPYTLASYDIPVSNYQPLLSSFSQNMGNNNVLQDKQYRTGSSYAPITYA